jgi:hypothetical protein
MLRLATVVDAVPTAEIVAESASEAELPAARYAFEVAADGVSDADARAETTISKDFRTGVPATPALKGVITAVIVYVPATDGALSK